VEWENENEIQHISEYMDFDGININNDKDVKKYLTDWLHDNYDGRVKNLKYKYSDRKFNFADADFKWNEDATEFSDLNFTACNGIEEIRIKDFDEWLKSNFPKEYEMLVMLNSKKDWMGGFKDYVIWTMQHCDTNNAGCYVEEYTPLILFRDATKI